MLTLAEVRARLESHDHTEYRCGVYDSWPGETEEQSCTCRWRMEQSAWKTALAAMEELEQLKEYLRGHEIILEDMEP